MIYTPRLINIYGEKKKYDRRTDVGGSAAAAPSFYRVSVSGAWKLDAGNLSRALSTGKGTPRGIILLLYRNEYTPRVCVCACVRVRARRRMGKKGLALTAAVGAF